MQHSQVAVPLSFGQCVTVLVEDFFREQGYTKSTVLACLCSWCEEFIEEPFKLLEQLVQQLIDYGVVLAVSAADVKIAHDFILGRHRTTHAEQHTPPQERPVSKKRTKSEQN